MKCQAQTSACAPLSSIVRHLVRTFTLRNPEFEVPLNLGLLFRWGGVVRHDVAVQLAYQEQYLQFQRHLLENLQSTSLEHPDWHPIALSLSLRAGAIKTYVISAVAVLEGALAGFGGARQICANPDDLYDLTFGQLLGRWSNNGIPRSEIEPIWQDLQLLRTYRNHVHLARAADDEAYWQDVVAREQELLRSADRCLEFLA